MDRSKGSSSPGSVCCRNYVCNQRLSKWNGWDRKGASKALRKNLRWRGVDWVINNYRICSINRVDWVIHCLCLCRLWTGSTTRPSRNHHGCTGQPYRTQHDSCAHCCRNTKCSSWHWVKDNLDWTSRVRKGIHRDPTATRQNRGQRLKSNSEQLFPYTSSPGTYQGTDERFIPKRESQTNKGKAPQTELVVSQAKEVMDGWLRSLEKEFDPRCVRALAIEVDMT